MLSAAACLGHRRQISLAAEKLPSLSFKAEFRGQLTPRSIESADDFLIQAGPHRGFFFRLRCSTVEPSLLSEKLASLETHAAGAIYCAIPDYLFRGAYAEVLAMRGYKFWNYEPSTHEMIYYRWNNTTATDKVPDYATSIEGAGLLILSPDESKILLVHEYGNWVYPGGAGNKAELAIETASREAFEETGVSLDPAFKKSLLGGWNVASSRDNKINDHYLIFSGKALNEELHLDNVEISKAKWFSIVYLLPLLDKLDDGAGFQAVDFEGARFDSSMLFALRRYVRGHAIDVQQPSTSPSNDLSSNRRYMFFR